MSSKYPYKDEPTLHRFAAVAAERGDLTERIRLAQRELKEEMEREWKERLYYALRDALAHDMSIRQLSFAYGTQAWATIRDMIEDGKDAGIIPLNPNLVGAPAPDNPDMLVAAPDDPTKDLAEGFTLQWEGGEDAYVTFPVADRGFSVKVEVEDFNRDRPELHKVWPGWAVQVPGASTSPEGDYGFELGKHLRQKNSALTRAVQAAIDDVRGIV